MTARPDLTELLALPPDERLAIATALWNSLEPADAALPVPAWHLDVIASRLSEDDFEPEAAEAIDTVIDQIAGSRSR